MASDQLDLFGETLPPAPGRRDVRATIDTPSPSGLTPATRVAGLLVGTCSFVHEHWKGVFYPEGLPAARELAFYARHCNAVEIDASFYRVPSSNAVRRWLDETPADFRFSLKAPKSLTHDARLALDDPTARRDWEMFLSLMPLLGDRLASVLLQLAPGIAARSATRLAQVLDTVPRTVPLAVEFRHPTWNAPEVSSLLRERGAVRVWGDAYLDPRRGVAAEDPHALDETGPFLYVRLLGDVSTKYAEGGGLRHRYGAVLFDRNEDLALWSRRIAAALARGIPVQCFINNHYEGFSPLTAIRLSAAVAALR